MRRRALPQGLAAPEAMAQLRPLGPSAQEIEFLQSHFVRYTKSQKKEFARLQQLGPASADDIAHLQALLGPLPADYAAFLCTHNGGKPVPNVLRAANGRRHVVNELLALSFTQRVYASVNHHLTVYGQRIPKLAVPIGRSPSGDLYLLDLRPASWGAVCLWQHEQEAEGDGSQHWDNVIAIAPSFTAFLNGFGD